MNWNTHLKNGKGNSEWETERSVLKLPCRQFTRWGGLTDWHSDSARWDSCIWWAEETTGWKHPLWNLYCFWGFCFCNALGMSCPYLGAGKETFSLIHEKEEKYTFLTEEVDRSLRICSNKAEFIFQLCSVVSWIVYPQPYTLFVVERHFHWCHW